MSSKKDIILAFDAYGTLLSTESIAKQLASHFGEEKATKIAAESRKYQLEYTWRLNSMSMSPARFITISTIHKSG
jgi:2-haloacid dehalogenase